MSASVPASAPSPAPTPAAATQRDPPSQPASPLAKRTKMLVDDDGGVGGGDAATAEQAGVSTTTPSGVATPTPTPMPPSKPVPVAIPGLMGRGGANISTAPAMTAAAAAAGSVPLQVKMLSDKGRAPTRGSAFAAGYDLYSAQDITVEARGKALVDTAISIAVPAGTYGRIAPRSGLASKHSIDVGAGVIDADYRGPLKILLFNLSDVGFQIKEGDRIAQLVLERIYTPEVMVVDELEESVRGAGGFGSTGGFAAV